MAFIKTNAYLWDMDALNNVKTLLEELKPKLASKYGVDELGLFGSVTRADFSDESDIDIVVGFNKPIGIEFIDLADELETMLNRKVDLVSKKGIKSKYLEEIQQDIVYV